jgi:hypothetical protein
MRLVAVEPTPKFSGVAAQRTVRCNRLLDAPIDLLLN